MRRRYLKFVLLAVVVYCVVFKSRKAIKIDLDNILSSRYNEYLESYKETELDYEMIQLIDYLPHFSGNFKQLEKLKPKIRFTKHGKARIVIGISTVKREGVSYLEQTLQQLFSKLDARDKVEALVVVQICDQPTVVDKIIHLFHKQIRLGLLEIVVPPLDYYPDIAKLAEIELSNRFEDTKERVQWRIKQNYDYAYLMAYCLRRGSYYLQLEDDVIVADHFINHINAFIGHQEKNNKWVMLEFTEIGFIGKLFHMKFLPLFIHYFLINSYKKPVDMLLEEVFELPLCQTYFKMSPNCVLRHVYKPSLFQHIGIKSSLKGKRQYLKDCDFNDFKALHGASNKNPHMTVKTSLRSYSIHNSKNAMLQQVQKNDYIQFEFQPTVYIKSYSLKIAKLNDSSQMTIKIKSSFNVEEEEINYRLCKFGLIFGDIEDRVQKFRLIFNENFPRGLIIDRIQFISTPSTF